MWPKFILVIATVLYTATAVKWLTVYQKLAQEEIFSEFFTLLQANRVAKTNLYHRGVTVFAPTNEAFASFNGTLTHHLTSYHVVYGAKTAEEGFDDGVLESVQEDFPPLWVTRREGYYYINNALILDYPKGFVSKNRQDIYGKTQVLYVIDEVLDPVVKTVINPTAYDFLSRTSLWTSAYTVGIFFSGLIHNRLENIFRSEGKFTFFLPIDAIYSDYRLQFLDVYSIKAHIVPNRVLFTRPSIKLIHYETLTSGEYISVVVSLIQEDGKYYVRGNTTLGDSNHQTGVIKSEIIFANIPVKNGVVHLITKPLALYNKKLTKFPYVSILDKFTTDPMLNVSYVMGLNSGFNEYFSLPKKKFTFFVPRDVAWYRLKKRKFNVETIMKPGLYHLAKQILERHLIIGEVPISMETLEFASAGSCVNLSTPAGRMCLSVGKENDDGYVLKWRKKKIPVSRANYECVDGILHVVDAPFLDDDDFVNFDRRTYINFVQIWNALQKLLL